MRIGLEDLGWCNVNQVAGIFQCREPGESGCGVCLNRVM